MIPQPRLDLIDVRRRIHALAVPFGVQTPWGYFWFAEGTLTDLSSVPRLFWRLVAPYELGYAAPLVHDVTCRFRGDLPEECLDPFRHLTAKDADDCYHWLALASGAVPWRARLAWLGVRAYSKLRRNW